MGCNVGAHPDGHQHGGWKPTETSVTEFCYKSVNLSCENWQLARGRGKTTKGQYSPVRLKLGRLVRSLLYGTRAMLVLNFPAFKNKKYTAFDRFHGNGPYDKIPIKKKHIRMLRFALP